MYAEKPTHWSGQRGQRDPPRSWAGGWTAPWVGCNWEQMHHNDHHFLMVFIGNMIIVGVIKDKSPSLLQISFSNGELHLGQCCRGVHHLPFHCHSCFKSFLRFQKYWSHLVSKTDNVVSTYHCFVHPLVILDLHQRHRTVVLPPRYSFIEIPPCHRCIFQILSDKLYQNIWYSIKHVVSEYMIRFENATSILALEARSTCPLRASFPAHPRISTSTSI